MKNVPAVQFTVYLCSMHDECACCTVYCLPVQYAWRMLPDVQWTVYLCSMHDECCLLYSVLCTCAVCMMNVACCTVYCVPVQSAWWMLPAVQCTVYLCSMHDECCLLCSVLCTCAVCMMNAACCTVYCVPVQCAWWMLPVLQCTVYLCSVHDECCLLYSVLCTVYLCSVHDECRLLDVVPYPEEGEEPHPALDRLQTIHQRYLNIFKVKYFTYYRYTIWHLIKIYIKKCFNKEICLKYSNNFVIYIFSNQYIFCILWIECNMYINT